MGRKRLVAAQFEQHTVRSALIRKIMVNHMRRVPSKRVAVLLSAGVDSHACLFAALEAGKDVTCYSFTLDDRISTDYRVAQLTAAQFDLPFVGVRLSTRLDHLKSYLRDVFNYYNTSRIGINKSSVECLWPLYTVFSQIVADGHDTTVIGFGGDTFFCQMRSQKKRLHEYEAVKQEYYTNVVANGNDVQTLMLHNWCAIHSPGHNIVEPFHTAPMFRAFEGMHPFTEGCVPIQKAPVRFAFWPQFVRSEVRVHQSFQKGDSGISDHFSNLLIPSDWNTRELKSVKGIYNDLETGQLV